MEPTATLPEPTADDLLAAVRRMQSARSSLWTLRTAQKSLDGAVAEADLRYGEAQAEVGRLMALVQP